MDSKEASTTDFNEARKLLDKLKYKDVKQDSPFKILESSLAVVKFEAAEPFNESFSYFEKENMKNSVEQGLRIVSRELVLRSDKSLIRYDLKTPVFLPISQNEKSLSHFFTGVGGMFTFDYLKNPIAMALVFSINVLLFKDNFIEKKHSFEKESKIRNSLGACIVEALAEYEKGNMEGFLKAITKKLDEGERLFIYENSTDTIVPNDIIEKLLDHGMRPDGAAYILNTIGEALISGKIRIKEKQVEDHEAEAVKIFIELKKEKQNKLMTKAKELDMHLKKKKLEDFQTSSSFKKLKSFIEMMNTFLNSSELLQKELDCNSIAQEDIQDSMEMSFESRMIEMQYVAKINLLLVRITQNTTDFEKIKKEILDKNKIFLSSKDRIKAIEDFLWAMKGEILSEEKEEEPIRSKSVIWDNKEIQGNINSADDYLNYIHESIRDAQTIEEKQFLLDLRAQHYELLARTDEKEKRIKSFFYWKKAQTSYNEIIKLNKDNQIAFLGSVKCLIKLAKFKQAITLLKSTKNEGLWFDPDFWILGSIAYRKQNNYSKAKDFILEAKKLDSENPKIKNEIDLIDQIQKNNVQNKMSKSKENKLICEEKYYNSMQKQTEYYKILSIDGGGIRGIIPAFWLMEIERRTNRPISHLFNMLAGTSTGAIISAGLSCPLNQYAPKYSAFDLLEIYRNGQNIFTKDTISVNPFRCKYNEKGRLNAFKNYFRNTKLKQCLNDVIVPAVWEENLTKTFCFNSYDAKLDESLNFSLVDVLMATSAAPTFFPAHQIAGKGIFLDGGVHANNPAEIAYAALKSEKKLPNEKIFMLSLGTGSYLPDNLGENISRDNVFWAKNLANVTLPQQQGNIDQQMFNVLGKNYNRWQVWLENQIALDDYRENQIDQLMEIAQEHIEELYSSEENSMNKVLEILSKE